MHDLPPATLRIVPLLGLAFAAGAARAQWTSIDLTPPGMQTSYASAVLGDTQAGSAGGHAGLWHGTPDSFIDLNPPGATSSWISAISADEQVGTALIGGTYYVGLWRGTPESWVLLAASTCVNCAAMTAVGNGTEVGWVGSHAFLWHGTPESQVDLSPSAPFARALGGDATHQAGVVEIDNPSTGTWLYRAVIWLGAAHSGTSLQGGPYPFIHAAATGFSDGQTVGYVTVLFPAFFESHPVLWNTTADFPTILSDDFGEAYATYHGWQTGAIQDSYRSASVWHGSAASWESLAASLPLITSAQWWDSEANAIWTDDRTLSVAGYARYASSSTNIVDHAILWSRPICYANCDSSTTAPVLNVSDFLCFETKFVAGDMYANCDNSSTPPILNVNDFLCFLTKFAGGCQ